MAKQTINIGTRPSDGSGDPLRISFSKINENFDELYAAVGTIVPIGGDTPPTVTAVTSVAGKGGDVILTVADVVGAVSKNYVDTKIGELVNTSVDAQFNAIVDAAPESLNTIRKVATAIQNDPNYYLSVASQLGDKLSKSAGGSMLGPIYLRDALPSSPLEAATKQYVDDVTDLKANKTSVYTKAEIDALLADISKTISKG